MHVFITGASGFVGSALTQELIANGHRVLGMTRTDAGAEALAAMGAEPYRATLEDLDAVRRGAEQADAVAHLAFNHDFANYQANCEDDRRTIAAIGAALKGSDRPMLVTSGTGMASPGRPLTEDDPRPSSAQFARMATDEAAELLVQQGVNVGVVALPQVHDTQKAGLLTYAFQLAAEKGFAAYVGEGSNAWAAAHISDVARLYRLALEKGEPGARYHAVGEEGAPIRDIAEAIGRRCKVPARSLTAEAAPAYFGWLAAFVGRDGRASSALTRQRLNWRPTGPGLIADIEAG